MYIYSCALFAPLRKYTPIEDVKKIKETATNVCILLNVRLVFCCWCGANPIIAKFLWTVWRIFIFIPFKMRPPPRNVGVSYFRLVSNELFVKLRTYFFTQNLFFMWMRFGQVWAAVHPNEKILIEIVFSSNLPVTQDFHNTTDWDLKAQRKNVTPLCKFPKQVG